MWAVVVAEGLDIFRALRKGEMRLVWMGPDTAAIGIVGWEGPISMGEKKFAPKSLRLGAEERPPLRDSAEGPRRWP
jgi:hypothetical protein